MNSSTPPTAPLETLVRLRALIVLAFFEPLRDHAELRKALTEFVSVYRTQGQPCEQALLPIKGLLEDEALAAVSLETHRVMHQRIVRWVIEAYYNEPSAEVDAERPKKAGP